MNLAIDIDAVLVAKLLIKLASREISTFSYQWQYLVAIDNFTG